LIAGAIVAIFLLAGIPGFIAGVASTVRSLPPGFSWGTFSISASAVVFLIGVSWLRRRPLVKGSREAEKAADDQRENREISVFTVGLFLIAFVFACATWTNSVAVGWSLGSMVVAYFALGAILALVNFVEFAVAWTIGKGVFGPGARPRVVGAYAVVFVIGLGVLNAWLHPFHRVRPCDGDCAVPKSASPDERPTAAAAARVWYEQAKAAYGKARGEGPVPMLIVATAGGGIRAAYWTRARAATLDKAKNESVNQSPPVAASRENPYFAHLAMCTEGTPPPVHPPLGWVLSSATQTAFQTLLGQCGNGTELEQLEIALGKKDKSKQARDP
jgi:putative Mn2+ efflux pump MntP